MNKNTIIAIVLSTLLVVGYFLFIELTTDKTKKGTKKEEEKKVVEEFKKEIDASMDNLIIPVNTTSQEKSIKIDLTKENYKYKEITFSTKDAGIRSIQYKDYLDVDPKNNKQDNIEIVEFKDERRLPFSTKFYSQYLVGKKGETKVNDISYFTYDDIQSKTDSTSKTYVFYSDYSIRNNKIDSTSKTDSTSEIKPTISSSDVRPTFRMYKKYIFYPDKFEFDVQITFQNLLDENINIRSNEKGKSSESFSIYWGEGLGSSKYNLTSYDTSYKGVCLFNSSYFGDYSKMKENGKDEDLIKKDIFKYIGIYNRYFVIAFLLDKNFPKQELNPNRYSIQVAKIDQKAGTTEYAFGLLFSTFDLGPKDKKTTSFKVYLGPQRWDTLDSYNVKLQLVAERSWFSFISWIGIGIEWLIFAINGVVNNFGLTIILLALIFKIVLFPLSKSATVSTQKMQSLQPKINDIQNKFKDPQARQKAMMELYKKEKINPMGGCLPILLQIPFFLAFYNVMPYLIDMKNSVFLWINDLSSPETFPELFDGFPLRILPLVMTGVSILQSLTMKQPAPATQGAGTQKMMMYILPVVFLFVFWGMPSGLVLYWTVQSILQILQQVIQDKITKKKITQTK